MPPQRVSKRARERTRNGKEKRGREGREREASERELERERIEPEGLAKEAGRYIAHTRKRGTKTEQTARDVRARLCADAAANI